MVPLHIPPLLLVVSLCRRRLLYCPRRPFTTCLATTAPPFLPILRPRGPIKRMAIKEINKWPLSGASRASHPPLAFPQAPRDSASTLQRRRTTRHLLRRLPLVCPSSSTLFPRIISPLGRTCTVGPRRIRISRLEPTPFNSSNNSTSTSGRWGHRPEHPLARAASGFRTYHRLTQAEAALSASEGGLRLPPLLGLRAARG